MPKSANQKLKLLYLMQYLLQKSDEKHPISIQQMIDELARHDIKAERKTLYDDMEALRLFGLDIIQARGKTTGYYIGNRTFELPELKLLVDSVTLPVGCGFLGILVSRSNRSRLRLAIFPLMSLTRQSHYGRKRIKSVFSPPCIS